MFYVSSIKDNLIGITDSNDNIEEFYTDIQIAKFIEKDKLNIYGTSVFNHKADCTVLKLNTTLDAHKLASLLNNWKKVHNQWNGHPVEDYLACAKVGTKIKVEYVTTSTSGARIRGVTKLVKRDCDLWYYEDKDNMASGEQDDSRFAAWCLEVACIYCKMIELSIY